MNSHLWFRLAHGKSSKGDRIPGWMLGLMPYSMKGVLVLRLASPLVCACRRVSQAFVDIDSAQGTRTWVSLRKLAQVSLC